MACNRAEWEQRIYVDDPKFRYIGLVDVDVDIHSRV